VKKGSLKNSPFFQNKFLCGVRMNDFVSGLDLEKEIKVGCLASILVDNINKKLFGEILTIIDAVGKDAESKKAIKSLVSNAFTRNTRQLVLNINALPKKEA
jgi:hypothetical protein